MTLSGAKARFQLNATATPTGTLVTGPNVIGQGLGTASFSDADIAYSFKVQCNIAGDTASLDPATGIVTASAGSPSITDGDGKDFEGVTLPALSQLRGVIVYGTTQVASPILVDSTGSASAVFSAPIYQDNALLITTTAVPTAITFDPQVSGNAVTVTVIGKS